MQNIFNNTVTRQVCKMRDVDGIYITVTKQKYKLGSKNIKKVLTDEEYIDFQIYVADYLCYILKQAIDRQRFKGKWRPLSVPYLLYKRKMKYSLKIWEATGKLKSSIRVFKFRTYIAVGFDERIKYDNKVPAIKVNLVARFLEFGTSRGIPARPLFRNCVLYTSKHINDIYKNYKKELDKRNVDYLYIR